MVIQSLQTGSCDFEMHLPCSVAVNYVVSMTCSFKGLGCMNGHISLENLIHQISLAMGLLLSSYIMVQVNIMHCHLCH